MAPTAIAWVVSCFLQVAQSRGQRPMRRGGHKVQGTGQLTTLRTTGSDVDVNENANSISSLQLEAATFDPDGFAFGESDRFIERIDKKHLPIPPIPGLAKPRCTQIKIRTDFLQQGP